MIMTSFNEGSSSIGGGGTNLDRWYKDINNAGNSLALIQDAVDNEVAKELWGDQVGVECTNNAFKNFKYSVSFSYGMESFCLILIGLDTDQMKLNSSNKKTYKVILSKVINTAYTLGDDTNIKTKLCIHSIEKDYITFRFSNIYYKYTTDITADIIAIINSTGKNYAYCVGHNEMTINTYTYLEDYGSHTPSFKLDENNNLVLLKAITGYKYTGDLNKLF